MALELKHVVETNLIRASYHCISRSFHCNSHLKQLYISNKTQRFGYKSRCSICGHTYNEAFERRDGLGYRQTALGYYCYLKQLYH